jgi:hypothetical protein
MGGADPTAEGIVDAKAAKKKAASSQSAKRGSKTT